MSSGLKGSWACVGYHMTCVPQPHPVVVGGRLWSLMFIQPCSETHLPSFPTSHNPSTPFSLSVPLSGPYCVYLTAGTGGATVAWIWPLCTYRWWIHLWLCLHPEVTCHCLFSPQSTHTGRQFGQGSRGDWQVADPLQAQFTHCLNGRVVHPLSPFTLFN